MKHQLRAAVIAGLAALTLAGASACKVGGGTDSPGQPGGVNNDPGLPGGADSGGMGGGLGAPGGSIAIPAR